MPKYEEEDDDDGTDTAVIIVIKSVFFFLLEKNGGKHLLLSGVRGGKRAPQLLLGVFPGFELWWSCVNLDRNPVDKNDDLWP